MVKSKKNLFFVFVFLAFFGMYYFQTLRKKSSYPIQTISSFAQVDETQINCNQNSLVLFDIDDTVLIFLDALAHNETYNWGLILHIIYYFPQFLRFSTWEYLFSSIWKNTPRSLSEPNFINFINNLKQKGCTVLGLTSMESGYYGIIPDMPEWRYQMLKRMGIVFSRRYPNQIFNELP